MSPSPSQNDPELLHLVEISSEFSPATQVVEVALAVRAKALRLSFDNGYSIVVRRDGSATIEPF